MRRAAERRTVAGRRRAASGGRRAAGCAGCSSESVSSSSSSLSSSSVSSSSSSSLLDGAAARGAGFRGCTRGCCNHLRVPFSAFGAYSDQSCAPTANVRTGLLQGGMHAGVRWVANIQCLLNMLSSDIRCHAVILTAPLRGHGWRTLRRTCAAGAAGGGTSSALGLGAGASSSSLSLSLDGIMPAVDDWPPARSGPTM